MDLEKPTSIKGKPILSDEFKNNFPEKSPLKSDESDEMGKG